MTPTTESKIASLLDKLIQTISDWRESDTRIRYRKFSVSLPRISTNRWLSEQDLFPQFYFQARNSQNESAAVGQVWQKSPTEMLETGKEVLRQCASDCALRIALPFGLNTHNTLAFLPEFELSNSGEQSIFSITVDVENRDVTAIRARLNQLSWGPVSNPAAIPNAQLTRHVPSRNEWQQLIEAAVDEIEKKHIEKVVLGRETQLNLDAPLHPADLIDALEANNRYRFWFKTDASTAFFGRSPERLFKLERDQLDTEAVASTLSAKMLDEAEIRHQLLSDPKERLEHQLVIQDITERLESLCSHASISAEHSLHRVGDLTHLKSDFHGQLAETKTWVDALFTLHPTAAIGGYPRAAAQQLIRQIEPISRGYYSGPIGWASQDSAEFAVGIRSGTIEGHHLTLYSGTGIVSGSIPDNEWHECDAKIQDVMALWP